MGFGSFIRRVASLPLRPIKPVLAASRQFTGATVDAIKGVTGGGGGGGGVADSADTMEKARQARIKAAMDAINGIFNTGNRNSLYQQQRNSVFQLNKSELDRQAAEAGRENKFGLMRNGLIGSSVQAQSEADLNRRTNEGLLRVTGAADQAATDLKAADEKTRSNLLSMAQTGIDSTTAAQQASKGLELNANQAQSARSAASIGGLFDGLSNAYLMRQMYGNGGGMMSDPYMSSLPSIRRSNQGVIS